MSDPSPIPRIQAAVQASGLDGWLIYDFRGLNPFAGQLLQIKPAFLSRRWFLYIPARGPATLIHARLEASTWQHILPDPTLIRRLFSAHDELDATLRQTLAGSRRIAMETSPMGEVPYVSTVDAGTVERVRACQVEVVSSADLLQGFYVWSQEDKQAHLEAVKGVIRAKDAGFDLVRARLAAQTPVSELDVQEEVSRVLRSSGLEFDHPAIVAFGSHASDGHYSPNPETNLTLEMGMCVLIDLWAGYPGRPMVDVTWVGHAGEPGPEYMKAWEAVRDGRDLAIRLLTTKAVNFGWEVDRAARELITARGYGPDFNHRLGHSLGRGTCHGPCANLDDFETHDTRRLLPGLAVTIEPGVYPGPFGVRSEVNVLITENGAEVTTPVQQEPYRLG